MIWDSSKAIPFLYAQYMSDKYFKINCIRRNGIFAFTYSKRSN